MRLPRPERRSPAESAVPMINVVFLLLVFFLMTATLAPPDPLALTPPESALGDPADRRAALYLAADGRLAARGASGQAALAAVAEAALAEGTRTVALVADRAAPSALVARTLAGLAAAGVVRVELVLEDAP